MSEYHTVYLTCDAEENRHDGKFPSKRAEDNSEAGAESRHQLQGPFIPEPR